MLAGTCKLHFTQWGAAAFPHQPHRSCSWPWRCWASVCTHFTPVIFLHEQLSLKLSSEILYLSQGQDEVGIMHDFVWLENLKCPTSIKHLLVPGTVTGIQSLPWRGICLNAQDRQRDKHNKVNSVFPAFTARQRLSQQQSQSSSSQTNTWPLDQPTTAHNITRGSCFGFPISPVRMTWQAVQNTNKRHFYGGICLR